MVMTVSREYSAMTPGIQTSVKSPTVLRKMVIELASWQKFVSRARLCENSFKAERRSSARRRGGQALAQVYQQPQRRNVLRDGLCQAGALHFDRDAAAVEQGGIMHLGNRRRTERGFAKGREHFVERCAEFGFNGRTHCFEAHRRQFVVQQLEFRGVLFREQVALNGEHLAELDEGQAEFLNCLPNGLRRRRLRLPEQKAQYPVPAQHTQDAEQSPRRADLFVGGRLSHYRHVILPEFHCREHSG